MLVLFPALSAGKIGEALVTQLEVAVQAICKDAFPQLHQLLCFVVVVVVCLFSNLVASAKLQKRPA